MITHLEPDILEREVKWALESITTNKANGGDGIPVELFQTLKDDAVKVLHSICQQIWKTQQWPQDWKRSVFIPVPNSSSHVWMWELNYKESWALKNRCFWTVLLEKTLDSPLDCKEIQPVHPKRDQSWIFIGRTDVEAETPIPWPPDVKSWLFGKGPDAGKDLKVGGEGDDRG